MVWFGWCVWFLGLDCFVEVCVLVLERGLFVVFCFGWILVFCGFGFSWFRFVSGWVVCVYSFGVGDDFCLLVCCCGLVLVCF